MHETAATRQLNSVLGILLQKIRRLQWACCFVLIALALFASTNIYPQTSPPSEGQVKAAYLYNFGKFVKWPAGAPANQSGAFVICVLDQDPFGITLQSTLAGESVGGKPVIVKRLPRPLDAPGCHILFISSAQEKDLKQILVAIDDSSVLTVSDMPNFSKRGGMIEFVPQGDRIRFEINLDDAERSHLVFPSELLKVAVAVRKSARSGD
jgi:YfiR/HmsC-like